jgi:hypothetical protein
VARRAEAKPGHPLHRSSWSTRSLSSFDTDLCPESVQIASAASRLCQTGRRNGFPWHGARPCPKALPDWLRLPQVGESDGLRTPRTPETEPIRSHHAH